MQIAAWKVEFACYFKMFGMCVGGMDVKDEQHDDMGQGSQWCSLLCQKEDPIFVAQVWN